MDAFEGFLHSVSPALTTALGSGVEERAFVFMRDEVGIAVEPLAEGALEPRELLGSLLAGGAQAAAYATYLPGRAEVVAHVYVGPGDGTVQDSNVYRAPVRQVRGVPAVGAWRLA